MSDEPKLLLSQVSSDIREPLVPLLFPALGAHITATKFQYPDRTWKEPCGIMANLVAESGGNKGQLSHLIEAICHDFRTHDETELQKLVEWQRQMKTRGANKDKPFRPDVCFLFPPSDITNAAFIQNAMALESIDGRTQYINLPEVEMADYICGGHKKVTQMLRNIYDRQRTGSLRATADGVTGNPVLRVNLSISSTPIATRRFYKNDLFNGTFGRMVFSYKPRTNRDGRIPRQGRFTEEFYKQLDEYLMRLNITKGKFIIRSLNMLIDRLAQDMATIADLTDDDTLWDMSKRSLSSAWKAGCVMWALNQQTWTKAMGEMVEWLVYHDLWSKVQIFADLLGKDATTLTEAQRNGPRNMLNSLSDVFSEAQLQALRLQIGKTAEGANRQLRVWQSRGFVTRSDLTGLYTKTKEYLER